MPTRHNNLLFSYPHENQHAVLNGILLVHGKETHHHYTIRSDPFFKREGIRLGGCTYYTTQLRWCQWFNANALNFGYMHKIGGVNLYNTNNVASRIKDKLSEKNISGAQMLSDLSMGVNALYQFEKGRVMSCFALAAVADYLDVSVDYLLGRTDKPEVNR
jgi:hypothetical protein